jgi:hypothetical protein
MQRKWTDSQNDQDVGRKRAKLSEDDKADWTEKEQDFLLQQAKEKAKVRVEQRRATPIDWIILHVCLFERISLGATKIQLSHIVRDPVAALNKLKVEQLDGFLHEMHEFCRLENDTTNAAFWKNVSVICNDMKPAPAESRPIAPSISKQINEMLENKSLQELEDLEVRVKLKLSSNEPKDEEYWGKLLTNVIVARAKEQLHERHKRILNHVILPEKPLPKPVEPKDEKETAKDEEFTGTDVAVMAEYPWAKDYPPRKPKFQNRVHMGYEWNNYNQAHYTNANPPPRVVQGYKFTIYYPDLIDSKPPTYTVTPSVDNPEVAVLRFSSGAPYQDVAFEILRRDWEKKEKKGFRSDFDNGVLTLQFRFKPMKYRQ